MNGAYDVIVIGTGAGGGMFHDSQAAPALSRDTSCSPSIGEVNPALTARANALRVGEHLLARMGVSAAADNPVVGGR